MKNEVNESLSEEIVSQIQGLSNLTPGTDEMSIAIDDLVKLCKVRAEERRIDVDAEDKYQSRIQDEDIRRFQIEEQSTERRWKYSMAAAQLGVPLLAYGILAYSGFKLETTGCVSSFVLKDIFKRFKTTK